MNRSTTIGYGPGVQLKVIAAWAWTSEKGPEIAHDTFTVIGIETTWNPQTKKVEREVVIIAEGGVASLSDVMTERGPSVVWSVEEWQWPTGVREIEEHLEEHKKKALNMELERIRVEAN